MKKKVLIVADSLEIGGIERSLICMLNSFDYNKYEVDLMLYSKQGELLNLLNKNVNLIEPCEGCKTFGVPVKEVIKKGNIFLAIGRVWANIIAKIVKAQKGYEDIGYYQTQIMYNLTHPFLKSIKKHYDVAIAYAWPHNFVVSKVQADTKVGWIHTDYSTINVNRKSDLRMWSKLDYIVSISDDCSKAFLKMYPSLKNKIIRMDNIISSEFIKSRSKEQIDDMNGENFKILSIGRICHQKGFDIAVRVLKRLKEKGYDDIKWYIVGFGPDEEKIKVLIKENNLEDSFILLGKKVNPYPYLKKCDIYVQPSRYEGKAVTIQEAKILGKPIIVTNYETASSQIEDGEDGVIAEMNVDGIAEKIETLYLNVELQSKLKDNCKKLSLDNKEEVEKIYSIM